MTLEYQLTVQDFLAAQRLHFRPGRLGQFMLWVVAGFCVAALLQEVWVIGHHGVLPRGWWILPAGLAYGALLFLIFLPWRVGKIFQKNPRLAEPTHVEVGEDGVLFDTKRGQIRATWSLLKSWKHNRAVVLVYQSRVHFHIIPRRGFASDVDYAAFQELFKSRLGPPQ